MMEKYGIRLLVLAVGFNIVSGEKIDSNILHLLHVFPF